MSFKVGDLVKVIGANRVFKVKNIVPSYARDCANFLADERGSFINPAFCKLYTGATSVFEKE